ncbi:hypothetical protein CKM354_000161000 [Cercospora kikuchii]|uniref:Uncharacterized protein n=1 Tax=Cercospora kikuchii TaxID=84275 RepID=A0A9P3C7M0_9PEZI|nr:uncharacterized protein CKM354_000161000 [Cercospora kikuchii]GIZ38187.1 hypothetical protein CKM354_000161000 [Cercospora kikuchii]
MAPFLQEFSKRKMSADDVECLESTLALQDMNGAQWVTEALRAGFPAFFSRPPTPTPTVNAPERAAKSTVQTRPITKDVHPSARFRSNLSRSPGTFFAGDDVPTSKSRDRSTTSKRKGRSPTPHSTIEINSDSDEEATTARQAKRRSKVTDLAMIQHHNINLRARTSNRRQALPGFTQDVKDVWQDEDYNNWDDDYSTTVLEQTPERRLVVSDIEDCDDTDCRDSDKGERQPESQGGSTPVEDEELNPFLYEDMIPNFSRDRQDVVNKFNVDGVITIGKGDQALKALSGATLWQQAYGIRKYILPSEERTVWMFERGGLKKHTLEPVKFLTDCGTGLLKFIHDRNDNLDNL